MPRPDYHVFICAQQRPQGHPRGSCGERGAGNLLNLFSSGIMQRKLFDKVALVNTGCLGPCQIGANVLVYPGGVLYSVVQPEDVDTIIDQHFVNGQPVEAKFAPSELW